MRGKVCIALLACVVVWSAQAAWTVTQDASNANLRYITDGNWKLRLYNNYASGDSVAYESRTGESTELDLTSVESDTGRKITRVDNDGFRQKTDITKIILPDSCKVIWNRAFNGCTALETVGLPPDFYLFNDKNTFDGCTALKTIYLTNETPEEGTVKMPASITEIKGLMFASCVNIRKVIAPGVKYIGDRAFYRCSSLETLEISPELTTIDDSRTFLECTSLKTLYAAGTTPVEGTICIPSTVTSIPSWGAFFGCTSIERVIAPGVIDVNNRVFAGCTSLKYVELSSALAYLRTNSDHSDHSVFYNCTSLTNIYPSVWGPMTIGPGTFRGCTSFVAYLDLTDSGITEIPSMWAAYSALEGVTFPSTLQAFTGDQNFRELAKGATFRFLGNRPSVGAIDDKSPFYTKNNTSQRHTFVVDAATYPSWTNGTDFVAMADIDGNSDTKGAFSTSSADFPTPDHPSRTLGVTIWGSGYGRYNWVVQYYPPNNALIIIIR